MSKTGGPDQGRDFNQQSHDQQSSIIKPYPNSGPPYQASHSNQPFGHDGGQANLDAHYLQIQGHQPYHVQIFQGLPSYPQIQGHQNFPVMTNPGVPSYPQLQGHQPYLGQIAQGLPYRASHGHQLYGHDGGQTNLGAPYQASHGNQPYGHDGGQTNQGAPYQSSHGNQPYGHDGGQTNLGAPYQASHGNQPYGHDGMHTDQVAPYQASHGHQPYRGQTSPGSFANQPDGVQTNLETGTDKLIQQQDFMKNNESNPSANLQGVSFLDAKMRRNSSSEESSNGDKWSISTRVGKDSYTDAANLDMPSRRLASDKTWDNFTIQVYKDGSDTVLRRLERPPTIEPVLFQFALLERNIDTRSIEEVDKKHKIEVKDEELSVITKKLPDKEALEEFQKDLCRFVTTNFKCEKVSIPAILQEFVIPKMQSIDHLQKRSVILLHSQGDEYKVVGEKAVVQDVVGEIKHLVGLAQDMQTGQRQEENMDIEDHGTACSTEKFDSLEILLKPDEIKIIQELCKYNTVRVTTFPDHIEIVGKKVDIDAVKNDIKLKLKQVQVCQETVDDQIWTLMWNHKDKINLLLQNQKVHGIWDLPSTPIIKVMALTKAEADRGMNAIKNLVKLESLQEPIRSNRKIRQFLHDNKGQWSWTADKRHVFMFEDLHSKFQDVLFDVNFEEPATSKKNGEPTTGTSKKNAEPTTGTSKKNVEPTTGTSTKNAVPTTGTSTKNAEPEGNEKKTTTVSENEEFKTPPSSPNLKKKNMNGEEKASTLEGKDMNDEDIWEESSTYEEKRIQVSLLQFRYFDKHIKSEFQEYANEKGTDLFLVDNEIVLRGTQEGVQEASMWVNKVLIKIGEIDEVVPGVQSPRFRKKTKSIETEHKCLISIKEQSTSILYAWLYRNVVNVVTINRAPIEAAEADMMICPVANNLLPVGIGSDIFNAGDAKQLQSSSSCYHKPTEKGVAGFIARVPSSGRLQCQYVCLAVWPSRSDRKSIQSLAENLISAVMDTGCRSIAFPIHVSQSTDDQDITAYFLERFCSSGKTMLSHNVQLHFYTGLLQHCQNLRDEVDSKIIGAHFIDFNIQNFKRPDTQSRAGEHGMTDAPLEVKIMVESIDRVDEKVTDLDVIVNSTAHTLDLSKGYVSSLLLKKGGESIQSECDKSYSKGIRFGDIAFTKAGKLRCRALFHVALFQWINEGSISTEILKLIMKRCLDAAEAKGYSKIAIPALGTGKLKYPSYLVARTMFTAVEEFKREHLPSHLKEVLIVLSDKDQENIDAFKNVQVSMKLGKPCQPVHMNCLPPRCIMKVQKETDVRFVLAEKEDFEKLCINEGRLILNLSENKEMRNGWVTDENCYNFCITTNGSEQSITEALKKAFEVFVNLKHQVVDVFLLSRDISSAICGLQKQVKAVVKTANQEISKFLSTAVKAGKSQSQIPVCYLKMVRVFVFSKELKEMQKDFCEKKADKDFTAWQLYEHDVQSDKDSLYRIKVYGRKRELPSILDKIKSTLKTQKDEKPSTGQWYLTPLNQMEKKRDEAIFPELNDKLNQGADNREQFVEGIMKDKKYQFDLCEMQVQNAEKKLVFGLRYDDKKDVKRSSHHKSLSTSEGGRRQLPVPGKAVRAETTSDRRLSEDSVKDNSDDEGVILTTISCEVHPSLISKAKEMVEKMENSKDIVIEEKDGKIFLQGSVDEVKRAEKLIRLIENKVEQKKKPIKEDQPKVCHLKYEMSEDEYAGLLHFSDGESWFLEIQTKEWKDGKMVYSVLSKEEETVYQCLKAKIESMQLMSETDIALTKDISDTELKSFNADYNDCGCYLSADKSRIIIKTVNYEKGQEVKHKLEVKLGLKKVGATRRGRVFASNDPDYSSERKQPRDLSRSMSGGGSPQTPQNVKKFTTVEGLDILVYEGDILRLNVNCIVNAANEDLMHGGGVAFFIAQAAGYSLSRESEDFVRYHGPLKVGTCCTTTAGDLTNYHCVIHAVGPRWQAYRGSTGRYDCLDDLKETVVTAIKKAAEHTHTSIAIPAISSGIFGVPKQLCAQQYVRAVVEYSKVYFQQHSVKEVHFVDKDKVMSNLILKSFDDFFKPETQSFNSSLQGHSSGHDTSSVQASGMKDDVSKSSSGQRGNTNKTGKQERLLTNQFLFDVSDKIKVTIKQGDISTSNAKVIVCPQDEKLQCSGRIAKAIHSKAHAMYNDRKESHLSNGTLQIGDVFPLKTNVAVTWDYVYHVVPPRWGLPASRVPTLYETQLETIVYSTLTTTKSQTALNSIAIPLMGVSLDEMKYPTPITTCCQCTVDGIIKFANTDDKKELQIELWGFNESAVATFRDILSKRLHKETANEGNTTVSDNTKRTSFSRSTRKKGNGSFSSASGSSLDDKYGKGVSTPSSASSNDHKVKGDSIKTDEKCCICMDFITNPKQLPCCGSKYCTECIDTAFSHRKVCPNCNKVLGKLVGNQPKDGTMSYQEHKYTDLPGYKGLGHIKINYFIPSGIQGEEHPHPGKRYEYLSRPAYLPNNEKGRLVLKLLDLAFKQRLVFTIGESRTSGKTDVVTWNDIHHKTRMDGGPDRFGYPDPTYLDRVLGELADKGITEQSLKDKS